MTTARLKEGTQNLLRTFYRGTCNEGNKMGGGWRRRLVERNGRRKTGRGLDDEQWSSSRPPPPEGNLHIARNLIKHPHKREGRREKGKRQGGSVKLTVSEDERSVREFRNRERGGRRRKGPVQLTKRLVPCPDGLSVPLLKKPTSNSV